MTRDYSKIASDEMIHNAKKALEKNGFTVKVVEDLDQARQEVLSQIPAGSEVFTATSVTSDEAKLTEELNENPKYLSVRNKYFPLLHNPDTALEARRTGSGSDYTVGSVHAVTEEGQVVVASATGSQLPNYVYGATKVIWVVGAQKVVRDLDEAIERLESYVFPLENERSKQAYGVPSSINKLLIYRKEPKQGRITMVIVKQAVGY